MLRIVDPNEGDVQERDLTEVDKKILADFETKVRRRIRTEKESSHDQ